MTLTRLLSESLRFHWRGNLAVLLGAVVGTAVLTGALLVGDSLRGSLRALTLQRLGWVDYALISNRFFGSEVASRVPAERVSSAIILQGAASAGTADKSLRRAGRVMILGVDSQFWPGTPPLGAGFWASQKKEVVLNRALADDLAVKPGASITLHVRKLSAVPRETLLGRRDTSDVVSQLELTVREILPDDAFGSQFTLNPNPAAPRNAFVPLALLADELGQPGRINAIFVGAAAGTRPDSLRVDLRSDDWGLVGQDPETRTTALFEKLDRNKDGELSRAEWRDHVPKALADQADPKTGVLTRKAAREYYRQHSYFSLESRQMIIEDAIAEAALAAAREAGLQAAPTLVYLANSIKEGDQTIPYSVVAALDPALPPPLGPFLPAGVKDLTDDEIVLVGWKDSPLAGKVGDTIELSYFAPEHGGNLMERTAKFRLRGVLPLEGIAADPDLTPEFPGITDKLTLRDWDPPFPYDNKRVKKRDENYWNDYRTTPKAYITLAAGQKLWGSRFGKVTSIRLAPPEGAKFKEAEQNFDSKLKQHLKPELGGFVFDPVKQRGLEAAGGGTDFSLLFLGFSFFLIVAALLLIGLLFRLNIDRRAGEIGLLLALGYRRRRVRWLLIGEGALLAALGGLIGLGVGIVYAWGLIDLLRSWWPGGMDRSFLTLHLTSASLLIGYVASLAVGLLTIAWAVRVLGKAEPRALLAGESAAGEAGGASRHPRWSMAIIGVALLGSVAALLAGGHIHEAEAQAGTFFTGGFLFLTAGLAALWLILRLQTGRAGPTARLRIASLAIRNAARHPVRSLLTAGLLASAAFLIVAVESFHRQPEKDFLEKNGGSGGFAFLAESDVPVYQDLNAGPGHADLVEALGRSGRQADFLQGVLFVPLRLRSGDDASCLNLFQARTPRLLGVPQSLIERGGFQFAATIPASAGQPLPANPWALLDRSEDGTIPVFAEMNTAKWMLKKDLGDLISVPDSQGKPVQLRLVGLLQDSVFQSELLMSEQNFLRLYPNQEGYNFFLIDAAAARTGDLKPALETALASRGFEVTPSAQRLAAYLAVENTYLSTFQALGGLGLLLGALGLAVVLLRSVWERRSEMALLRALGFRRRALGWLVLVENVFLLAAGLGIGSAAALASVAPHVLAGAGEVPWLRLAALLLLVLFVGLAAGAAAMAATVRAALLPALRRE